MFNADFLLIKRALDFFSDLDFRINNRPLIRVIINYFKVLNVVIKRE